MIPDYLAYEFSTELEDVNILLAFLSQLPFESYLEGEDSLTGYIRKTEIPANFDWSIKNALPTGIAYKISDIQGTNWNAQWEKNFLPVVIAKFCGVRAPFHPPFDNLRYELVIEPRMAFGTGHHETTRMMMEIMQFVDFKGKRVMDFGCGSGILGILAEKMEADEIIFIDKDAQALASAGENWTANNCQAACEYFQTLTGHSGVFVEILLANVNAGVLSEDAATLAACVNMGGMLILSGILKSQSAVITDTYSRLGFRIGEYMEEGDWSAMQLIKLPAPA